MTTVEKNFLLVFKQGCRKLCILFLFLLFIVAGSFVTKQSDTAPRVDEWYVQQLGQLKASLQNYAGQCTTNSSTQNLRACFNRSRTEYKKLAVLLEFFNPYEAKLLNGPAIDRVEEDNPDVVLPPHGFQLLEEQLYNSWTNESPWFIQKELSYMLSVVEKLETEKDRQYKFKDEAVFDAFKSSVIRLITLGITGFDSPLAKNSIAEAVQTVNGLDELLRIYVDRFTLNNASLHDSLQKLIRGTVHYLASNKSFNNFNRLHFITIYGNPLYGMINTVRQTLAIKFSAGRKPVNDKASSLFAPDAFNVNFFGPDDTYRMTGERIQLGKMLFSDPLLSSSNNRSCASCHKPELAFTDGLAFPKALDEESFLGRNTPTLWNAALQTKQFYDSRSDLLENQLDEVVHSTAEMKGSLKQSVADIKGHRVYKNLFEQAYRQEKEPVTGYTIANAISSYVRSLLALNSRFDEYMHGNEKSLSNDEKAGFNLFAGKAGCATCHFIPLFNGLAPPQFDDTESEVLGVPENGKRKTLDDDLGKYNFTNAIIHKHSFKTPTLRNIALTAPYMHNGVFKTLDEVVRFYNKGGGAGLGIGPSNQTLPSAPLHLSKREQKQMVSFLKLLTDTALAR